LKGALNAFKVNKKIYGWPWYMSGQLLYINNEIFEAAGVTLPTDNGTKLRLKIP
jgi:ABC-type glycerol-3-phosphate transport system substrate-binding protein